MIGSRIGHYEITAEIGRGGMGEVYRARDTKLNRDVALKILPQVFALDSQRMARFEREAQVLASLNHTNIAQIYGIESVPGAGYRDDGQQSPVSSLQPPTSDPIPQTPDPIPQGTKCLVLELVEGETLQEQIARGPIPVDEALKIALQICEGLEAAHEKGIIHRDLKPANIKITPEGQVKILDFGLAKALEDPVSSPQSPASGLSHSPTITHAATQAGMILGTAAYMSPEQARGKPVDKRTDIWAFGCVLYEMLAGKKAFGGEGITDVIASIVKEEPDWSHLLGDRRLRDLLRGCLSKDLGTRFREIADVRIGIYRVLENPETDRNEEVLGEGATRRYSWLFGIPWMIALALAFLLLLSTFRDTATEDSTSPVRFSISLPADLTLQDPSVSTAIPFALSPDGSCLVIACSQGTRRQLFRRRLDSFEIFPIPGTSGATAPFFSPDSKWLGFYADGKLQRVSMSGGAPLTICETPFLGLGADWGEIDEILFSTTLGSGIWRVDSSGGVPEMLTNTDFEKGQLAHVYPKFLPKSRDFVFTVWGNEKAEGIWAFSRQANTYSPVQLGPIGPTILTSGHVLYGIPLHVATGVAARRFEFSPARFGGGEVSIIDDVLTFWRAARPSLSVSRNGALAYRDRRALERQLVWVDRKGNQTVLEEFSGFLETPRISPRGDRIVYALHPDIWIIDLEESGSVRGRTRLTQPELTEGTEDNQLGEWTPDGQSVVFNTNRDGGWNLYWRPSDGTGQPTPLLQKEQSQNGAAWAPDGKSLIVGELNPETGDDLWVLSVSGEPQLSPLLITPFGEQQARISPDGKWFAYVSNESGRDEVYVQAFPKPERRWLISSEGGREPVWSRDGTRLFYRRGGQLMEVSVETGTTFSNAAPEVLFEGRFVQDIFTNYDVSPDGDRFLFVKEKDRGPEQIHLVLNFVEELKRLVPTE